MNNQYLNREGAPLDGSTWALLDKVMRDAAKSQLTARRFIALEGPFGLGLKAVPQADVVSDSGSSVAPCLALSLIARRFVLAARDVAAYERDRLVLDTRAVASAAMDCARAEDELLLRGAGDAAGLLSCAGAGRTTLSSWEKPGRAAADILKTVTQLDKTGLHGPYVLALAPQRYNLLLRRYPDGFGTELDHLRSIASAGVHKAPALKAGGVLLAAGAQFSAIILGQDMSLGFIGPVGVQLEFSVTESLALDVREPKAVNVLAE